MNHLAAAPVTVEAAPGTRYQLSRFACLRREGTSLVLESALNGASLTVTGSSVLRLLGAFTRAVEVDEVTTRLDGPQRVAVLRFVEQCRTLGLLTEVDGEGNAGEDAAGGAHWSFHDLGFHTRSRPGLTPHPVGATWHGRDRFPPEPPFASRSHVDRLIPLSVPPEDTPAARAPLGALLAARRSRYATEPVPAGALAEFLHRTFRVTELKEMGADGGGLRLIRKVYPSGGSLHSLELYLIVHGCEGIDPGIYRYEAVKHALVVLGPLDEDSAVLLNDARTATGGQLAGEPPVLFVITSRFRRVMWKYEGLAYAAILKEVGCLFQTMYMVATAMGLAGCALGAGNAVRAARVLGLDYYVEGSVGEFILGGGSGSSSH